MTRRRDVILLGSTGSIGVQALDVVRRNPDRFRVLGLAAAGSDPGLLAAQAAEFEVRHVAIADAARAVELQQAITEAVPAGHRPQVLSGPSAATEVAGLPADVVLNGVTGSVGLEPTLAALGAGSVLALANKESLIIGGPLVKRAAGDGQIVPVDSEHSALAQALMAGRRDEVRRLILTASGGPFRGRAREQLTGVTPEEALAHPTWDMGPVVTINSATLVNKGLEVIEAHLLFDVPLDRIVVTVHPQSVVHSLVEFVDGSSIAQASPPDMRLPIALGLSWPQRVPDAAAACDWSVAHTWTFDPLDDDAFPAVALARRAGETGRTAPAVFNAANETAVAAFRDRRLPFLGIVDTVAAVLAEHTPPRGELTVDGVLAADAWARAAATARIEALAGSVGGLAGTTGEGV